MNWYSSEQSHSKQLIYMKHSLKAWLCLAIASLLCLPGKGQGEDYNWTTGTTLINFPGGTTPGPLDVTPGVLGLPFYPSPTSTVASQEGVASVSGPGGDLRFFANGEALMEMVGTTPTQIGGTLLGNWSTVQGATILPRPGFQGDYFLITNDARGGNTPPHQGVNYYDFSTGTIGLPRRLMRLVGTNSVPADLGEGITFVPHPNCRDYWLITHAAVGNEFLVYRLTPDGVEDASLILNDLPTHIQALGFNVPSSPQFNAAGTIKASRAGDRIAMTSFGIGIQLLEFDPATGLLSFLDDLTTIAPVPMYPPTGADYLYYYGAEFSFNGDFLYVSREGGQLVTGTHGMVFGFDLSSTPIIALPGYIESQTDRYHTLQRGPDGNIYFPTKTQNFGDGYFLGTIQNSGTNTPTYLPEFIGTTNPLAVQRGLPMTYDFSEPSLGIQDNDSCDLAVQICEVGLNCDGPVPMTYVWSFSDGSPDAITTDPCISHTFPDHGTYTVTLNVTDPWFSTPHTLEIEVTLEPCCPVIGDFNYPNDVVIDEDLFWNGQVLIGPDVTVTVRKGATLDITNTDVIFDICGQIVFEDSSMLRANNSVFRPCFKGDVWQGITFERRSTGIINECTFKNAISALYFQRRHASARITNNLFADCKTGVLLENTNFTEAITGNTFMTEDAGIDYYAFDCISNLPSWLDLPDGPTLGNQRHLGIGVHNSTVQGKISQNDFINVEDLSADPGLEKMVYGIFLNQSTAEITSNHFSGMNTSIFVADVLLERSFSTLIENNSMEVNLGNTNNRYQIGMAGVRNVQVIGNRLSNSLPSTPNSSPVNGIVAFFSTNSRINSNQITGFDTAIMAVGLAQSTITENSLEKTSLVGISLTDIGAIRIGCNTINMEQSTTVANPPRTGILIEQSNFNLSGTPIVDIHSNCIFETDVAIRLLNTNGPDPSFPWITNNYLYNYRRVGILNEGFNVALGTGLPYAESGRNTFVGNNHGAGALDLLSIAGSIDAWGNFGITTTGGTVTVSGNDDFNSTASCGQQINYDNAQQFEDEFCDRFWDDNALIFPAKISSGDPQYDLQRFFLELANEGSSLAPELETFLVQTWNESADEEAFDYLNQIVLSKQPLRMLASLLAKGNAWFYPIAFRKMESRPLSAENSIDLNEVQLYLSPNPTSNQLTVGFHGKDLQDGMVTIRDAFGRTINSLHTQVYAGELQYDVSKLSQGVYFVTVKGANGTALTQRFVKQ